MEHRFAGINDALPALASHLLTYGETVPSRNGNTLELCYPHIVFTHPLCREVVQPARAASLPAQIAETAWVLAGRNDIEWLSHYLPRAKDFSDDGETWRGGYGPTMRTLPGTYSDQLKHVVDLLKADPSDRRAVIDLYRQDRDMKPGKDVPCNNWLHFLVRAGRLHLHVATRSNDFMWGWSGINAFQWSVLLEVVAKLIGVRVGQLHFSISSFHVYDKYTPKTGRISAAEPIYYAPGVNRFRLTALGDLDAELALFFKVEEAYRNGESACASLEQITDPMLREWLQVLRWWWVGDVELEGVVKTAAELSPGRPERKVEKPAHRPNGPYPPVGDIGGERCKRCGKDWPCPEAPEGSVAESWAHNASAEPERILSPDQLVRLKETMQPDESLLIEPGDSFTRERLGNWTSPGPTSTEAFKDYVVKLHNEKHEAYGDSWKRRGEMLGILANIARKIDRLGGGETADETSADTAIDLLVYLAKYRSWLLDQSRPARDYSDRPDEANAIIHNLKWGRYPNTSDQQLTDDLRSSFSALEYAATEAPRGRVSAVEAMLPVAFELAYRLWIKEQS